MNGEKLANAIFQWANKQRMHPDDFGTLFADELIEKLLADKTDTHETCDDCGTGKPEFTREVQFDNGIEVVNIKQYLCVNCMLHYDIGGNRKGVAK